MSKSAWSSGVRWWPLAAVVALAIVAVVVVQGRDDLDQQMANTLSYVAGIVALLLALLWLFLFSRLRARVGLNILALGIAAMAVFFALFRVRGVTGDLVPIFEWRWGTATLDAGEPADPSETEATPIPGLADYPQFQGPERTGVLPGPELARNWTARPPRQLWRREVGEGWSGFAVAGRRAITQEQRGDDEAVVCYDVATGDVLWTHRDPARYETTLGGLGPRATPTIDGERVFSQGATGILNCLDAATGAVIWMKNILADNGAGLPDWGLSRSPLVHGDWLVVSAGGPDGRSLVAYDKSSGARIWSGGSDPGHYGSPLRATLAGVEQFLVFNRSGVAAHSVTDGEVLWTYPWKADHPHVCQPVVVPGDRVLVSSGYGTGSKLLQIRADAAGAFTAEMVWRSLRLKAKFTNVVVVDGFVYGLDDGTMVCIELANGRRRWKAERYGHGQVLLVGALLLVTTEGGEVVLVEPVPDEHRELARFRAFDTKTWNPPALAGEYLLVRNDLEAACYRLPVAR